LSPWPEPNLTGLKMGHLTSINTVPEGMFITKKELPNWVRSGYIQRSPNGRKCTFVL
jgi:hypothetical protein